MNTIKSTYQKSEYSNVEHLVVLLDNESLDKIIDDKYPDKKYLGLIPTLLCWLNDSKERKLIWNRILPNEGESTICPILMCPDDLDLWCTVIVVEIKRKNNLIRWKRFGLDVGDYELMPDSIGTEVEWFDKLSEYVFELTEYENMLTTFKEELEIDEIKSDVRAWIWRTNQNSKIPSNIIVINYGLQKVQNEYEIYLTGHTDYYKNHDTWLLDSHYEVAENYFGLGNSSIKIDRAEMLELYKNEIIEQLELKNIKYPSRIKVITACYSDGRPERIM